MCKITAACRGFAIRANHAERTREPRVAEYAEVVAESFAMRTDFLVDPNHVLYLGACPRTPVILRRAAALRTLCALCVSAPLR